MKKFVLPFAVFGILVACNSGSDNASETTTTSTDTTAAAPAATDYTSDPNYQKGLATEAKSDCATCHKVNEKLVGPSFKEIATKYAGADQATIDTLASKVIHGGAGNWGQVPMTPHPDLAKEDAETVVKYVLLLKD